MLCLIGFVPNQILVRIQSSLTPALQLRQYSVHLLRIIDGIVLMEQSLSKPKGGFITQDRNKKN